MDKDVFVENQKFAKVKDVTIDTDEWELNLNLTT
jgi:hypothetical protein